MRYCLTKSRWIPALALTSLSLLATGAAETATAPWPKPNPAAVAHWQSLRFGMFIHWGPVSLTSHEIGWSRGQQTPVEVYDNLYKQFNPTNFNADDWVRIAKDAGMKYIILTTKHHDGFCLWDTKQTDYNIMNSPFHRDVVKELAAACRKQDMAFGTYYSVCDWHHPDFPLTSPGGKVRREKSDLDSYNRYLLAQVSELITNYGPLLTIWNDVPQEFRGRGANTIKLGRELQPDLVFNNRTGDGGDYDTPEQRIGKYQDTRPWESCMTLSAHNAWAWGGANDGVKPLAACLQMVILGAGGDGNVLLNVGPRPDGKIDPEQANRLKEMGQWMTKYGESIYGTRGGPWKPTKGVVSTRKGNTVFLHVLNSEDGRIELPALPCRTTSAELLHGGNVEVTQESGKLIITIPKAELAPIDTVVCLKLDGSAMDIPAIALPNEATVKATASNVYRKLTEEFGPQSAFDNDLHTRWATDSGTRQAWIAAAFPKPRSVRSVRISEAAPYDNRVQKFELQYRDGNEWKTIFDGTTLGAKFRKEFEPVTAREVRLNILEATEGPTIAEIDFPEK